MYYLLSQSTRAHCHHVSSLMLQTTLGGSRSLLHLRNSTNCGSRSIWTCVNRTEQFVLRNLTETASRSGQTSARHFRLRNPVWAKEVAKAKPKVDKSGVRRLLGLAKSEKRRLAGAIALLTVSSAVTMSVPFALGKVIDIIYNIDQLKSTEQQNQKEMIKQNLNYVCAGLMGVFIVGGLANFGRVYLMRISGQNITAKMRSSVYHSIVRQEVGFFDKTKTGELINRLSADCQLVSQTITQQVSDGLRSLAMAGAGIGMMFFMSPQLAFVGLGIVPPVAAWAVIMGRKVRTVSREVQDTLADATTLADERISNIRTVRAFAKEVREMEAYDKKMDVVLDRARKEAFIQAKFYGMTGLSGNMIILTVLYYGGSLVTSDVITVGNLTSFILYAAYVGIGFNGLSTFYAELNKGLGASSRLWELIDRRPSIPVEGGLTPTTPIVGDIAFRNVSFAYPSRAEHDVIKDLMLEVKSDTVLAVVGGSGSGKSTLGSLLLRFYDPTAGSIEIDGRDITTLDPSWLRSHIGTVSQEPVLFSSSIRDNIVYGAPDPELVTDDEIVTAAKQANAHDFILGFPKGYDTMVGERGIMLSGGQKQRVAIARAILKNPHILLLDEATSALDAQSEFQVKEALERIMKGRSVITIAHRLSTIRNADQIAVLHEGRIVEKGSYQELLTIPDGHFRRLVEKQSSMD